MSDINNYIKNSKILYYCKISLDGNYTYVSPYFEEIFECSASEMIGVNSLDTIYHEDHDKTREIVEKCFQNPKTYQQVILRKPLKNESLIYTQWEFYLDTDENNQPKEIICYGVDLTKSIKNEQLLKQAKLELDSEFIKYQTLFETASLAIILHNHLGEIFEANQYFCDLVGVKKEEINQYNFKTFIPEKDWAREKLLLDKLLNNGNSISYEKEFINKDGDLVPISVNKRIYYDTNGKPFIWCLAVDILEREKQKELFQKQKELLEQAAHIAKLGGWELDLKTFETKWTKEVYDIHDIKEGYSHNLENGLAFYHPDDQEIIKKCIKNVIDNGERFDVEVRLISALNILKWQRVIGEPVYKNNVIVTVKGIIQDISERKMSQEIINKQNNLLKDISYTQSHTVRLPIANIMGLIDIASLTDDPEEKHDIYQKIKHSVNQLDLIIRDIANKKITD